MITVRARPTRISNVITRVLQYHDDVGSSFAPDDCCHRVASGSIGGSLSDSGRRRYAKFELEVRLDLRLADDLGA